MQGIEKSNIRKFLFVPALAVAIFIFGLFPDLVEHLYARGLYPLISVPLRFISSLLAFPLGDLLYLLIIGFVLLKCFLLIRKLFKDGFRWLNLSCISLSILRCILLLYIVFKILWGLNYSRPTINIKLGIADEKYTRKELVELGKFLVQRINTVQQERQAASKGRTINYSRAELQKAAVASYNDLATKNAFFRYRQPVVKKVLNNWLITRIGLEGYYSPLSGEANINMMIPATALPFVTCHEIAHQLGIGREDEANLIGYLVSTNSTDLNFKYSGYYSVLKNVLFEIRVYAPEAYEGIFKKLNAGTLADIKQERNFWMRYNSDMYGYMDVALDNFLKLNNQKKGIDSYQDIVIWLYNLHKKNL